MRALPSTIPQRSLLGAIKRSSLASLISLRYFILRSSTAGSALIAGLIQTFVFARVLTPEDFSIFILVGTLGVSMWLFDLGVPKILFVRLRACHLAGTTDTIVAGQANAVTLLYALLVGIGAMICFAVIAAQPTITWLHAAEFALFFLFSALNLVWFVLRNLSVAVDKYIYFETLEAFRRVVHIAAMLAMLVGLPLTVFLIAVNLMWALLFTLAARKLLRHGALTTQWRGVIVRLRQFFRENKHSALRTGTHAACELYIHNALYLVVPVAFGLGAPTIVADTTLKIFFGALVLYSAACDVLVPRQTSAYAARDPITLARATYLAAGLCAVPALAISGLLVFGAAPLFAVLLGPAATMPAEATPILIALLAAGLAKTVANSLLLHTGYFRDIARLAAAIAIVMTMAMILAVAAGSDMIGLLKIYAAIYVGGTALYVTLVIRGPVRTARNTHAAA
ncbi:MAG: hypothetical protein HY659_04960 [Rhizobiales bacterium]|nr:hypothetical protein [Hyphomicrobiales bacterium]